MYVKHLAHDLAHSAHLIRCDNKQTNLDLKMPDLLLINMVCMVNINLFTYSEHLSYRSCGIGYYVRNKDVYAVILALKKFTINKR